MLVIDLDNQGSEFAVTRADAREVASRTERQVPDARLARFGGAWVVSSFGTLSGGASVNGRPLRGSARLQDRDTLSVPGVVVTFTMRGNTRATLSGSTEDAGSPAVTTAEQRVLEALARPWLVSGGMAAPAANAEIAAELVLSVNTVKSHMRRLFDKFELGGIARSRRRTALVESAFRIGAIGTSG